MDFSIRLVVSILIVAGTSLADVQLIGILRARSQSPEELMRSLDTALHQAPDAPPFRKGTRMSAHLPEYSVTLGILSQRQFAVAMITDKLASSDTLDRSQKLTLLKLLGLTVSSDAVASVVPLIQSGDAELVFDGWLSGFSYKPFPPTYATEAARLYYAMSPCWDSLLPDTYRIARNDKDRYCVIKAIRSTCSSRGILPFLRQLDDDSETPTEVRLVAAEALIAFGERPDRQRLDAAIRDMMSQSRPMGRASLVSGRLFHEALVGPLLDEITQGKVDQCSALAFSRLEAITLVRPPDGAVPGLWWPTWNSSNKSRSREDVVVSQLSTVTPDAPNDKLIPDERTVLSTPREILQLERLARSPETVSTAVRLICRAFDPIVKDQFMRVYVRCLDNASAIDPELRKQADAIFLLPEPPLPWQDYICETVNEVFDSID